LWFHGVMILILMTRGVMPTATVILLLLQTGKEKTAPGSQKCLPAAS